MTDLARLCLGTVKLGLPWYGAGSVSRPTDADKAAILERAVALGIRWFDTGAAYGDAEDWVTYGMLHPADGKFATKVSPALARCGADLARTVYGEMWDVVLLHNPTLDDISAFHKSGLGASVYHPAEALAALAAGLRVLQVPYCLLDRRHAEVMQEAKAAGVTVFARQPFLQGVLVNGLMTEAAMRAEWARSVAPVLEDCWDIMAAHEISRVEACLWFALDSPADYVVFGCGSVAHLEEVVAAAQRERPAQWPACQAALRAAVEAVPAVELQSLWK